jgi:death on curing protein
MPLEFLELAEVLEIHHDQLERHGGRSGIRDKESLQSALAVPAATFGGEYLHIDLAEMASAYLFHIVRNHPFIDGNKRTGTVAALVFLLLNGYHLRASNDDVIATVTSVAAGTMSKEELVLFFRSWTRKLPKRNR